MLFEMMIKAAISKLVYAFLLNQE